MWFLTSSETFQHQLYVYVQCKSKKIGKHLFTVTYSVHMVFEIDI